MSGQAGDLMNEMLELVVCLVHCVCVRPSSSVFLLNSVTAPFMYTYGSSTQSISVCMCFAV